MIKRILLTAVAMTLSFGAFAANTIVEMKTSMGKVEIELFDEKAPISVKNFESYINSGFYKGTIFHRVISDFMIQGGGMTVDMVEKETQPTIINESSNGLLNERGTLAMARRNDPNSAASQFFINVADNDFLNKDESNAGYAVFGKVIKGMDIVDEISKVPTATVGFSKDVPRKPIKIESIKIKTKTN